MLNIRVLLPEPETPVTQIKSPSGISTSMFLRLCSDAPLRIMLLFKGFLLFDGSGMMFLPDRYFPVMDFGSLDICLGVPVAIILPPYVPAAGPRSIT